MLHRRQWSTGILFEPPMHAADANAMEGASDATLLHRFMESRDERAFEQLVWRHGLLVLSVCRRALHRNQDIEDAFQATFLALVRKAGTIAKRESIASWLYKVAYRTALQTRSQAVRRREKQSTDWDEVVDSGAGEAEWQDLRSLLDEEAGRLPEKYRLAFLLCDLEGYSSKEAARIIGCPEGTVRSRLARARKRLRIRLTQRGITFSAGLLALAAGSRGITAAAPVALARSTLCAAVALATGPTAAHAQISPHVLKIMEGVLRTMFPTRLKMLAALLLFTIVGVGGIVGGHLYGSNPPSKEKADSDKNQPADPVDWKLKDTYLAGKMTNLSAVVLSPDGKLLATADDDKGVQLWDIAEGKEIDTLLKGGREKVRALAFSADGKTLAAGAGNDIYRWMVSTRKFLPALTPNGGDPSLRKDFKILTLAFSPDGKRLAQGGTSMACAVWDLEDIHASTSFVHNKESRGIVFNPDGKSVAVAGMFDSDWKKLNRPLPSLLVFDLARDDYGARMSYLEAGFNCVAYSADGTLLAAGSPDHAVHVFCLEKEDVRLEGHDDEVLGIEFAPKGDLLASCGKDKTIRIWDVQKQKLLATLKGHKKPVRLVQFSGDGRTLISVDDDGVVKIWVD